MERAATRRTWDLTDLVTNMIQLHRENWVDLSSVVPYPCPLAPARPITTPVEDPDPQDEAMHRELHPHENARETNEKLITPPPATRYSSWGCHNVKHYPPQTHPMSSHPSARSMMCRALVKTRLPGFSLAPFPRLLHPQYHPGKA